MAPAAYASRLPELTEAPQIPVIPKYWHKHKSQKVMAVFARKASAFIRLDSPTFLHGVAYYSRSVLLSLIATPVVYYVLRKMMGTAGANSTTDPAKRDG